jgi:hypothetical protein
MSHAIGFVLVRVEADHMLTDAGALVLSLL